MTPDPVVLSGARPGAMPTHPRPQLATLADRVPEGSGWIYEIKLDGYRILARIEDGAARLLSRNGRDWTDRFPETAAALARLPVSNALLDGEVVAMGADGVSSFRRLQEALSARRTAGLVYQVFDLLHIDGFDLTRVPLVERKETLSALLEAAGASAAGPLRFTDHIEGKGTQFLERVCRLGLEGIVCKRLDGPYREGRARQWIKVKCTRHEELVVGGYTDPGGARTGFGALLLGAWRDGRLRYAGKVGTGFSADQLTALHGRMRALEVDASPFDPAPQERGVHWVRPELVAEVEFTEWTRDGVLRHPSFRGLREDRDAEEIELPDPISAAPSTGPTRPGPAPRGTDAVVAGVRLSHPERVLFPDQGVTKLALAQYYEEIADWILPGLIGRPLSLVRCPQGHERQCFFQKHPGDTMKGLPRVEIQGKEGPEPYLYVRGLADLVALVQAGTLELHLWGSRVEDLERPDLLVFDLDPAPELPWGEVLRTARALGDRLAGLGLESFVRTTGGKGLHLVAPLIAGLGWDEVKAFARGVAQSQVRDDPRRLTINMSKSKRQGRIFLDYLRNGRGATAIASYSTRARQGAPVAVPVRWDELSPALRSDRYTVENLRRRLRALRADPWEGFEEARRPITPAMMDAVGASASGRGAGAGPTDPAEPS